MSKLDNNVETVRALLSERSAAGIKKYGCTTDEAGIGASQWAVHAQEELLDGAVYLQCLIQKLALQNNEVLRLRELNNDMYEALNAIIIRAADPALSDDTDAFLRNARAVLAKTEGAV